MKEEESLLLVVRLLEIENVSFKKNISSTGTLSLQYHHSSTSSLPVMSH